MSEAIRIGDLVMGGGNEIIIQSMTNIKTSSFDALLNQINELYDAGCKLVRLAVSNQNDIDVCSRLMAGTKAVLCADIQFDYRLAIASSDIGFKKIRINPGNIGGDDKISEIVKACKNNGTVIRVGSNSGSIEKTAYQKYGNSAAALSESALKNVLLLEKHGFNDIVISAKSGSVSVMIETNRLLAKQTDYPLHLGVTESGTAKQGLVKSAIGIGSLLCDGIGDTIRVSLSASPLEEVYAAKLILRSAQRDRSYCEIISCPTCARCSYNLIEIANWLEDYTKDITKPLKIAVMGCAVNGPGEARECDFGVAGGEGTAAIFEKGEIVRVVPFAEIYNELRAYIAKYL